MYIRAVSNKKSKFYKEKQQSNESIAMLICLSKIFLEFFTE